MDERIENELKMIRDTILSIVPVEQIYLFGSYAQGTAHNDSDLDIFVVMSDNTEIREIDAIKLINRSIRDKKTMSVDVVVSRKKTFDKRKAIPSIEKYISQEGMILYG